MGTKNYQKLCVKPDIKLKLFTERLLLTLSWTMGTLILHACMSPARQNSMKLYIGEFC